MSIIYTSGTTGRPKGVVRQPATDEQREATQRLLGEIFALAPGERTVIPAPMYHTAPNVYALSSAVRGMDMTIMERFDAEEFLRIVEQHRVSVVQMVPTMFVRLLALPEEVRARYDTSSLRLIVHAAAPCPPDVKRRMIDWLGPIVARVLRSTETGPVVYCDSDQWLSHPGTVGRPLERAIVKVLDAEGHELPAGESGEVFVWLDVWPDFTYEGDHGKRRAIERDGLVSCGDIGYLDADGYLYLNDRRKRHGHQRRRQHLPGRDRGLPAEPLTAFATARCSESPTTSSARRSRRYVELDQGADARRRRRARARAHEPRRLQDAARGRVQRRRCRARTRGRSSSGACASPTGPGASARSRHSYARAGAAPRVGPRRGERARTRPVRSASGRPQVHRAYAR